MQQPRISHLDALIHTLRYISHTKGQGILLKPVTLFDCKPTQIHIGLLVLTQGNLLLAMCFCLVIHVLFGVLRSKAPYPNHHLRQNTKLWPLQHMK